MCFCVTENFSASVSSLGNFEILIAVLLLDITAGHIVLTRGDILRVTSYAVFLEF